MRTHPPINWYVWIRGGTAVVVVVVGAAVVDEVEEEGLDVDVGLAVVAGGSLVVVDGTPLVELVDEEGRLTVDGDESAVLVTVDVVVAPPEAVMVVAVTGI